MNSEHGKLISVVIPVYNEQDNVVRAYRAVREVFAGAASRYRLEFVFTDNRSSDRTFDILQEIAATDKSVKAIRFNRNYGFQRSLMTGYRYASGDAAIQLDCERLPRKLMPWDVRQHASGINVNRVTAQRLHNRHAVVGNVPSKIGRGCDAILQILGL